MSTVWSIDYSGKKREKYFIHSSAYSPNLFNWTSLIKNLRYV